MLTEICGYLKNWFDIDEYHRKYPRLEGSFTISNNTLPELDDLLVKGQCFYIYGSFLNDGVYIYNDDLKLRDERFKGFIQSMKIPSELLNICAEIEAWQEKYGGVNSQAMSPYNSESFGGYSYSKSAGNSSNTGNVSASDPISMFASRLNKWRKL